MTAIVAMACTNKVGAQNWDFSAGPGSADQTLLNNDTQNWTYDAANNRWGWQFITTTGAALTANSTELDFAKGLLLINPNTDKVRVDNKKKCLTLNGKGSAIIVPDAKAGDKLTITFQTSSSTTARTITANNVTPATDADFATAGTTDRTTYTGTVAADGSVTLTASGGVYVYQLTVGEATTGNTGDNTGNTQEGPHAVTVNTNTNQVKLVLTGGEAKYYNTADVQLQFDNAADVVNVVGNGYTDAFAGTVSSIRFNQEPTPNEIVNQAGQVQISEAKGWNEAAYITWQPYENATSYNVYVKGGGHTQWTKIDGSLVRKYADYGRADAVGLTPANDYALKVVPVDADGNEMTEAANQAGGLDVCAYTRSGFAFMNNIVPGAYNTDGTLKSGARVLYVTPATAKTVTLTMKTGSSSEETRTGLQNILAALEKGYENRPLAIRIVGCINKDDLDAIGSSAEGLQIKGNKSTAVNTTIEGIGEDAAINGFGMLLRSICGVEIRNIGVLNFMDDGISLDTDNQNCWIHHCDVFYGQPGSDSDQVKGDGSIDVKGDSKYITISNVHFWDSGKCSLCGMTGESGPNYISYDHNWFDHADSRMARIRTMSVHLWNNYYDGNAKYGVGATTGSSAFVDRNYFRNTKYPVLISMQGTDTAAGDGTFSGEDGGMIKTYGNVYAEKPNKFKNVTYQHNATDFDCYEASTPGEQVPASVRTKQGGTAYDNFDTNPALMYTYDAVDAAQVPEVVTGWYGAGRMNKGDLKFTFNNTVDDASAEINNALKTLVTSYRSKLVGIYGEPDMSTGGSTTDSGNTGTTDNGGTTTTPETPGNATVIDGPVSCNFNSGAPSAAAISVTGNYRDASTTIDGTTYTKVLKLESATQITFTTAQKTNVTCYFGTGDTNFNLKADGTKLVGANGILTFTVEAGSHTLTKADIGTLALITMQPAQ